MRSKTNIIFLVVALCALLLFGACGRKPAAAIPLPPGYQTVDSYEKYVSPAERGSLYGRHIAFAGTITQTISQEGAFGYVVQTEKGNWLVVMGTADAGHELEGKEVLVYGTFEGFSTAEELPAVFTDGEQDKILVPETNETYYFWGNQV